VLTDDGKSTGETSADVHDGALRRLGKELGALRRAIDNNVLNFVRHKLVVTDTGIHLESVPLDKPGDLPDGCVPTEKVQALAVALCGEVYGGLRCWVSASW
jgi:hypothetical protein